MKIRHLLPITALFAGDLAAQQPDIVEEVREASRPMDPIEKQNKAPEPFISIRPTEDPEVAKFLDPTWDAAKLYFNQQNEGLQEIALTGLLHLRATRGEVQGLPKTQRVSNRRARLGARLKAFYNTTVDADVEFQGNDYERINDLKVRNHFNTNTWISVGKMKAPFSHEWSMHSRDMKTMERTPLVNQLHPRRSVGILIESQFDSRWGYQVGLFSGQDDRELGGLSNPFVMLGLSYDFANEVMPERNPRVAENAEALPERLTHKEEWYLHYIHNFAPEDSTVLGGSRVASGTLSANTGNPVGDNQQYRHLLATGFNFEEQCFAVNTEMLWARGNDDSVWGLAITPSYWVKPGQLELVGRYSYAGANNSEGLLLNADPTRDFLYSNTQVLTGDSMHSFYLGGNYYPYAEKLNIQGGIDYTVLDADNGQVEAWTYFLGTRLSF